MHCRVMTQGQGIEFSFVMICYMHEYPIPCFMLTIKDIFSWRIQARIEHLFMHAHGSVMIYDIASSLIYFLGTKKSYSKII